MTYKEYFEKGFAYNEFIKPILHLSDEEIEKAPKAIKEMVKYYKSI